MKNLMLLIGSFVSAFSFSQVWRRLTTAAVLTALVAPVFLFQPVYRVSAKGSLPINKPPTVSSAPPAPYVFPSSGASFYSAPSASLKIDSALTGGSQTITDTISAPRLTEGFSLSKQSIWLSSFVSSNLSRLGSFFGFFSSSSSANDAAAPVNPVAMPGQLSGGVDFDFDGDGKADVARWNPAAHEYKVKNSSGGTFTTEIIGSSSSKIVPADYDGDGKTDYAVFSNGTWTIKYSSTGTIGTVSFGAAGDTPAVGDYDGDGISDLATTRVSSGNLVWNIRNSSNLNTVSSNFGAPGDVPVAGKYDGDNITDLAVFRPSNGYWYIMGSVSSFYYVQLGLGSDIPVPADYDGDGQINFAVYRASTGIWYVLSGDGASYTWQPWGNYSDQPAPADYDGDGKADYTVWRPTTGTWYILKSSNNNYDAIPLGAPGDIAVSSAYLKQSGGELQTYDFAKIRLSPKNRTGGTDLYSQNFSWSQGLVGLPGRAGMNMGFGISYNSLVWTKYDSTMVFDADESNITPGFRFGFPTIEPAYLDSSTGRFSYLMVMPSGERVEFKQQLGASNIYETVDSSYTQLKIKGASDPNAPPSDLAITVTATDGTMMNYSWIGNAYRLTEIKDTNGNFITINNDEYGLLRTVTDTLGRVVTVNYDTLNRPTTITQNWKDGNGAGSNVTHTYATFNYTIKTVTPNFDSSITAIYGPQGTDIGALESITYTDGSSTRFDYNNYGQVYKVTNIAPNTTDELNYVKTNLETPSSSETDCPRFSSTSSWAKNFNLDTNGTAQPVVVTNTTTENSFYSLPGGISGTATQVEVSMDNAPHNLVSKQWYNGAGSWKEGLPFATEDYADGSRQRWTLQTWTQDDINLLYKLNPRVTESKVGDTTNTKRTEIIYSSSYGLVSEVKVYDADQSTVLKRATTSYNLDAAYTSRRIIGLPSEQNLYDENNVPMSKVTYAYDEGDFSDSGLQQSITPVQHDNTNFGSSFIIGRGNLTSVTRHNVADASSVTSSVKYNTAGAVVAQITPGSAAGTTRTVKISYADNFNDNVNTRNTFAYPTTLTDPAGYSSLVKYRFDTGGNIWAKSPAPTGNASGKETTRTFDAIGRLERQTLVNTGAYTRYEYPTNGTQIKVYTTVTDANNNGADAADEITTESITDGAGRVRWSRTANPNSTGGWSATQTAYDILGQAISTSVPTEVDFNWQLAGDGQTRGWLFQSREYDWKGRVTKSINTDGSFSEASYDGCGCAGGEIVTIEGEQLAEGRRKQKIYSDILGRQYKTEILNWDGTIYSSTVTKYNGRDQAVWVKQFEGAAPADALTTDSCPAPIEGEPQTCQITKMTYDGHGRLKTQHRPQQDTGSETVFEYYQTDEVQTVTDARGATTTYNYNNRGLVTGINYSMPAAAQNSSSSPPSCDPNDSCCLDPEFCPPGTQSPRGNLDSVDSTNWTAKGWSYDPDNSSQSNIVHFYIDGPAGTGTYIGDAIADKPRPDVNSYFNISGNHGFEFTIPNQYLDGRQHTIYAHGIDTGSDAPSLLPGSPKSFSYTLNSVLPSLDSTVTFEYDNAGNRLWMTDSLGRTDYEYDSLSRLTAETRKFTDTTQNGSPLVMTNAPLPNNSFKLQYSYGLANQLTSLTDPFGAAINYDYDAAGRLKDVTGTSFGGVATYASGAKYQAWGGLKELTYGSGLQMQMTFNNRLQADSYSLAGGASGQLMNKSYDYYTDGALRYAQDLLDPKFDRLNIYDNVGRIKEGKTGLEARGGTVPQSEQKTNLPYRQSYEFNAFNNLTVRNNLHWGQERWFGRSNNLSYTYKDNRIQGTGWQYDAEGRNLQTAYPDDYATSVYNAAGQMIRMQSGQVDAVRWYDGNGREIKRQTANYVETSETADWVMQPIKYYIRSSVLGNEVVSEVWANGKKGKTFVRAAGSQLAYQSAYASDTATLNEAVFFEYSDASGMSQRTTDKTGAAVATGDGGEGSPVELDPLGSNVGTYSPYQEFVQPYEPEPAYPMLQNYFVDSPMYINGQQVTATLDGMPIGWAMAMNMLENGSAIPASIAWAQNLPGFSFENHGLGIFTTYIPGHWEYINVNHDDGNGDVIRVHTDTTFVSAETRTFYFDVSWNLAGQTRQQIKREQKVPSNSDIQSAIQSCIDSMFGGNGILVSSFTPSEKGIFGSISIDYIEGEATPKSVIVTNDTMLYSISDLNKMNPNKSLPGGVTLGITFGTNTTNYTARDRDSSAAFGLMTLSSSKAKFLQTQIHEFGHFLGNLFNKQFNVTDIATGKEKEETGEAFENCVSGVLLTSRKR